MTLYERAMELTLGCYQQALIDGSEAWSGASLKGTASSKWGASYYKSRKNLLKRLTAAGVAHLTIVSRGKIELKLGGPRGHCIRTRCAVGDAWIPNPTVLDLILEAVDK